MQPIQKIKPPKIIPQTNNPSVKYHLAHPPKAKKSKPVEEKKTVRAKIWAVDFDGTLHFGRYPNIGPANEDLIDVLKGARVLGVLLVLWTSREGAVLDEAIEWCRGHGLEFDSVNDNPQQTIDLFGYNPRKVAADLYIDDRAIPFKKDEDGKEGSDSLSKLRRSL